MFLCVFSEFSFGRMSSVLSALSPRPIALRSPELSQICACSFHKCNVPKCHFFTSSVLHFALCIPIQCFLFSFWIDIIPLVPFVIKHAAIFLSAAASCWEMQPVLLTTIHHQNGRILHRGLCRILPQVQH